MDTSIDVDPPADGSGSSVGGADPSGPSADRSRVGMNGRLFAVRAFAVAAVALGVGGFLGGLVPIVGGTLGRAVGVAGAAFLLGALLADRRYVETALAGIVVGAATSLLGLLTVGFLPVGVRFLGEYGVGVAGFGALLGLVLAVVGYYFGRDLRDGLTREVGA
ncbi:hypothetical protein [Halopenitus persicus]|uniref:Uncharacterized protein n=1 Tax=Halopenitus persicus TaxID=1048396 RepID=A0A1H3ES10_9EURY|nr:hypothetical protein [Halopenitus persicus]SDX81536.1 hypothetical protein SAMN05216564_101573 [Halopenitus persicus]